ncbi:FMN-binding negative transcriptional regulator [Alloyangia pacifica]|uniref:Negative transcriptional regulator, PaiB family n=1 Tax=Alloyangia pacifica TaxID=311180 RepID=A0A1I6S9Q0_9RHOB|nr:FMN-binding negative transcriptional regulator [Alloyangia pacifica]SDG73929.1 negative transcriptional regulator, PaiB family [Alloyangia pacifica]SFS73689.1 negative transcriptional regulator, PaiB family [Alloyangia pacifica]
MHPNPIFRRTAEARSLELLRARSFGTLAVSAEGAPLLSHVPFLLSEDASYADLHLVRSNPICRAAREGVPARLAVSGPDGYVSPDWYGDPGQVPTWNYVAVHLTGRLEPLPQDQIDPLLAEQSAAFEGRLAPKTPWTMDKMDPEVRAKLQRMILPFRLHVDEIDSTWKLSQNKTDQMRRAAANALESGFGQELGALATLMQDPPPDEA